MALRKIEKDSVPVFLSEIQPAGTFYRELAKEFASGQGSKNWQAKLFCNMERARWRLKDYPQKHKKYIMVNIPSFHLMAVDERIRSPCASVAEPRRPRLLCSPAPSSAWM